MHTRVGKSRSLATAHWTASNLQQQLTAAAAYSNNNPQQQLDAEPHSQHRGRSNIVAASDDFAVSTEDAVTHQECLFITTNICMQGAQYLEK